jgi:uncharacterized protein YjbI with pentapeptide repeats
MESAGILELQRASISAFSISAIDSAAPYRRGICKQRQYLGGYDMYKHGYKPKLSQQQFDEMLKSHDEYLRTAGRAGTKLCVIGKDLRSVDAVGADLRHAVFINCNMTGAKFSFVNMFGAMIEDCLLQSTELFGSQLVKVHIPGTNLSQAHLTLANVHIYTDSN